MVEQTDFQLHYNAPGRPLWSNFQGTATRHFLNTKIARKHTIQALPFLKKNVVPPFFLCANWCEFLVEETTYSLVLGSHGGTVSRQFMYTKIRLQTRSFFSKTSCHPFLLRELCHFFLWRRLRIRSLLGPWFLWKLSYSARVQSLAMGISQQFREAL